MKKLLLTTILAFSATLAYAGSGCCPASGDKDKTKDAGKSGLTEASTVVAGSGCSGGSCGDKDKSSKSGNHEASVQVAGSSCCPAGGDKDKSKDAGKSGLTDEATDEATVVAGSSCGGGSCGDKETKSKLDTTDSLFAGSGCGGGSCGDKSKEKSGFSVSTASIA